MYGIETINSLNRKAAEAAEIVEKHKTDKKDQKFDQVLAEYFATKAAPEQEVLV